MDGGTGSFNLMPILSQYPYVVFVDATMDNKPAGSINVLYPEFAADFPSVLSAHDVGLKDMIEALEFQNTVTKNCISNRFYHRNDSYDYKFD